MNDNPKGKFAKKIWLESTKGGSSRTKLTEPKGEGKGNNANERKNKNSTKDLNKRKAFETSNDQVEMCRRNKKGTKKQNYGGGGRVILVNYS